MDLVHFSNIREKEYEIIISGKIGVDVDGKAVASEIRYLNEIGATKIIERINSQGGDVRHGYDIVDANINSDAVIETRITGLAASTAGWIAASGTKGHRYIMDYAKGMMHNPQISSQKLEDMEDGSAKDGLMQIRDSIATLLSNLSDMYKNDVFALMNKTAWFNAEAWVEAGLADHIVSSNTKHEFAVNIREADFISECDIIYENFLNSNVNPKFKTMSKLAEFYNLNSEASEEIVLAEARKEREALAEAQNVIEELQSDIENKDETIGQKDEEISNLKSEVESHQNEAIDLAVNAAIESGKFDEKDKAQLVENAKAIGIEAFTSMVGAIKVPHVDITNEIEDDKGKKTGETKEELAEKYQNLAQYDKAELKRIHDFEPEYFDKLKNAWEESE